MTKSKHVQQLSTRTFCSLIIGCISPPDKNVNINLSFSTSKETVFSLLKSTLKVRTKELCPKKAF